VNTQHRYTARYRVRKPDHSAEIVGYVCMHLVSVVLGLISAHQAWISPHAATGFAWFLLSVASGGAIALSAGRLRQICNLKTTVRAIGWIWVAIAAAVCASLFWSKSGHG
jgi:lysylphosphatidylglycerol synthetase-like protein (DUF2156 family)